MIVQDQEEAGFPRTVGVPEGAMPCQGLESLHWQVSPGVMLGRKGCSQQGAFEGPPRCAGKGCGGLSRMDLHRWFLPRVGGGDHSTGFHGRPHRGSQNVVPWKVL